MVSICGGRVAEESNDIPMSGESPGCEGREGTESRGGLKIRQRGSCLVVCGEV